MLFPVLCTGQLVAAASLLRRVNQIIMSCPLTFHHHCHLTIGSNVVRPCSYSSTRVHREHEVEGYMMSLEILELSTGTIGQHHRSRPQTLTISRKVSCTRHNGGRRAQTTAFRRPRRLRPRDPRPQPWLPQHRFHPELVRTLSCA